MRMTAVLGYSPTNSPGQPRRSGRDWSRCSTMPGPETPWSLPRSTGSADPSPRSPAPSPISANGESRCMSYATASIGHANSASSRGHHGQPNWSSNWAASAAPDPENPVAAGICRPPNPRSSAQTARTVAPACCDRGACASTGRSVRNRTSNCIPLSLLFPNRRAPEWRAQG